MAFEIVNPVCALWQATGLRYLIAQSEPAKTPTASAAPRPAIPRPQPVASATEVFRQRQPDTTPPPEPVQPTVEKAPAFKPVAVESWPAIWQEQFQKTRRGLFAWTYWTLGDDLLAARGLCQAKEGKAKRSQLMQTLLRELGHPAGTHTFWPAHLDNSAEPVASPEIFWSGVKALGCRGVIIMGSNAASKLMPQKGLRPLQQWRLYGQIVWILNDLDRIELHSDNFQRVLLFLKQAMKPFIRR